VSDHIDEMQNALGRTMLLKNPSTYVVFDESTWAETDFLREIARRIGCGLLLDVNNVFVSAVNHGFDPDRYFADFSLEAVGEIHLAGYAVDTDDAGLRLLIDGHDAPVRDAVWSLYAGDPSARSNAWVKRSRFSDIALDPPFLTLSRRDRLPLHRLAQRLGAGLVADDAARRQAGQPGDQEASG
jgi:hypothetical protein